MARSPLNPDEAALWARLIATVKPLRARVPEPPVARHPVATTPAAAGVQSGEVRSKAARLAQLGPGLRRGEENVPGRTLDSSWDRRLSRGHVLPDRTVDLHGHTLASAHALLDGALGRAIAADARVVLLVTGKPPRPESLRPHARGAIRAAVGDWLAASRHASSIAAVRNAHSRHGGVGALYIILRRKRS